MKWACFSQALTDCRQGEMVELCLGPVAMNVVFPVSIGKPHKMNNWEEFVGRHTRMRGPPCLLSDSCWFINWLALSNSTWILFSMNSMLNKLLLEHKSDTSIWKHFRNGKMVKPVVLVSTHTPEMTQCPAFQTETCFSPLPYSMTSAVGIRSV